MTEQVVTRCDLCGVQVAAGGDYEVLIIEVRLKGTRVAADPIEVCSNCAQDRLGRIVDKIPGAWIKCCPTCEGKLVEWETSGQLVCAQDHWFWRTGTEVLPKPKPRRRKVR